VLVALAVSATAQTTIPVTGKEVPELLPYENALRQIMQKWSVPGASVAITDGSRLIYARGLGYADREAGTPVQPTSRFRLASISKTIAGMTILKLAEEGRINLDAPFMTLIPDLKPISTPPPDPRMARVTVRQLLQHTAGFDRSIEDDHVNYYLTASRLFNEPVSIDLMTRYVVSQRLDFDPGTRYAYGNSAYQILGRIVERVTGKKFMEAAQEKILGPAGVTSIRIGGNLLSDRFPDEVKYYDYPGAPLATTAGAPGVVLPTPRPYNRRVDYGDSYGGLIGHTVDLMRYLLALEGRRGPALLNSTTINAMLARPVPAVHPANGNYHALTWRVIPVANGVHWWHSGGATGTRNLLVRRLNGRSWVVLTNTRPQDEDQIITDLFNAMGAAETQVRSWPSHDLFPDFGGPRLSTSAETLTFAHSLGSTPPPPQTLLVTAAPSNVNLTVQQPSVAWLKVDRLSATTPATLNISVEPAGLAPGEYSSVLTIHAPASADGSRAVRVVLQVNDTPRFAAIRSSASRLLVEVAAPDSRILIERESLAPTAEAASALAVRITDSAQVERVATVVRATPASADVIVPSETAVGEAVVSVLTASGLFLRDRLRIEPVSPALFSANQDGKGASLGRVIRTSEDGSTTTGPLSQCAEEPGSCVPIPIDLGPETTKVDVELEATGIRGQTDVAGISARIGDEPAEVLSMQPSASAPGVDMVTVRLPRSLAGRGELDVIVTVSEKSSNSVKIVVQ
jgi:N-acyl-D-amino-acid deacylase